VQAQALTAAAWARTRPTWTCGRYGTGQRQSVYCQIESPFLTLSVRTFPRCTALSALIRHTTRLFMPLISKWPIARAVLAGLLTSVRANTRVSSRASEKLRARGGEGLPELPHATRVTSAGLWDPPTIPSIHPGNTSNHPHNTPKIPNNNYTTRSEFQRSLHDSASYVGTTRLS